MTNGIIILVRVERDKFNILENLMDLYLQDLSAFSKELNVNAQGKFVYEGLEYYLSENELRPFFIYYNDELAGFVLLNSGKFVPIAVDYSIHEFFILKAFRKNGIGKRAAKIIFNEYPGIYKIEQLNGNYAATEFWKAVYKENSIKYNEMLEKSDGEEYMIQIFSI